MRSRYYGVKSNVEYMALGSILGSDYYDYSIPPVLSFWAKLLVFTLGYYFSSIKRKAVEDVRVAGKHTVRLLQIQRVILNSRQAHHNDASSHGNSLRLYACLESSLCCSSTPPPAPPGKFSAPTHLSGELVFPF